MGSGGRPQKASSDQAQTSKTSQDKGKDEHSSSPVDYDKAIKTLRQLWPHGHPMFLDMSIAEVRLHASKNRNYAGGSHPLGNFYRVANIMSQYPHLRQGDPAVALIGMVIKQIDNILWAMNTQRFYTEITVDEHLADISVYMKILRCIRYDNQPLTPDGVTRSVDSDPNLR